MQANQLKGKVLVLFDGDCNLCNRTVQFIIPRDKKDRFRFASLQGTTARELLHSFQKEGKKIPDSVVLIKNGKRYTESGAALRMLGSLSHLWPLMMIFLIVPPFIRNAAYKLVANNRYRWFGKGANCRVLHQGDRNKFLP